jgi:hypothetical protein
MDEQRFHYTKILILSTKVKVNLGMKVKIDRVSHVTPLLCKMQEQSLLRIETYSPGRKAPTINASFN